MEKPEAAWSGGEARESGLPALPRTSSVPTSVPVPQACHSGEGRRCAD